jgi:hypothetical protein
LKAWQQNANTELTQLKQENQAINEKIVSAFDEASSFIGTRGSILDNLNEMITSWISAKDYIKNVDERLAEMNAKCQRQANEIAELKTIHNNVIEQHDINEANLVAEREKFLIEQREAERRIRELAESHKQQLKELKQELEKANETEKNKIAEKLRIAEIDLATCKEKMNESLHDYKQTIDKLKQANNQRLLKLKKKLANCVILLNLIDKNVMQICQEETSNKGNNLNLLTLFLNSLQSNNEKSNKAAPAQGDTSSINNDSSGDGASLSSNNNDEASLTFEFDEAKFKEFIQSRRDYFEKSLKFVESFNEAQQLRIQLESLSNELKFKEEKYKVINFLLF